jgi:hypothetical protein
MGIDTEALQEQCQLMAEAILRGRVVPFLGAGVNLCDRPEVKDSPRWQPRADDLGLPSGRELAEYLTEKFHYPAMQTCKKCGSQDLQPDLDLARVSQYGVMKLNEGPLYDNLRSVFSVRSKPTSAHRLLATLPPPNADPNHSEDRYPLFVTTNYDDLLEEALGKDNVDLVFYDPPDESQNEKENVQTFWHKAPGAAPRRIDNANADPYHFFETKPVVLKIHGTIDPESDHDNVVITEDHYIRYLAEGPLENCLPTALLKKLRENHHLLFLGYSLRDWNFRVFLRRLSRPKQKKYMNWAIFLSDDETEVQFWLKKDVQVINVKLKIFLEELQRQLALMTAKGSAVGQG